MSSLARTCKHTVRALTIANHQARRSFATVVTTTTPASPPEPVQPAAIVEPKVVKAEKKAETTYTPPPRKEGGSLRSRIASFLAGFAVASFAGYGFLRGDVLEVTRDVTEQFVPVATGLKAQIGRLEQRVAELEKKK